MNSEIINAINNRNLISFYYEGQERIVEPHCYGVSTAGNECIRAYQTGGYSSSGKFGWKMYDMDKAEDIVQSGEIFEAPRVGYKRGDKGMSDIYAEV